MNRICVATFPNRIQAQPLEKRLTQQGIHAEIHDELRLEKLWFVSKPAAPARLEVPADQFEKTQQMLLDWDQAEDAAREAIHCPECGSLRVQYPQFTRKSMLTNVFLGLAAKFHLIDKEHYCEDCHFTWPKEGTKASQARPHMAPFYFIEGGEQTRPVDQTRR